MALKSMTVKLSLAGLDEVIGLEQVSGIAVRYFSKGEGEQWQEEVDHEVVATE